MLVQASHNPLSTDGRCMSAETTCDSTSTLHWNGGSTPCERTWRRGGSVSGRPPLRESSPGKPQTSCTWQFHQISFPAFKTCSYVIEWLGRKGDLCSFDKICSGGWQLRRPILCGVSSGGLSSCCCPATSTYAYFLCWQKQSVHDMAYLDLV